MSSIKIVFHEKLNAIQCICDFIGTTHECKEVIQRKIIFLKCSEESCSLCQDQIDRDEYNELRLTKDRDGYLVCGTCCEKIGTEKIRKYCFCRICYASVDEYCSCQEKH